MPVAGRAPLPLRKGSCMPATVTVTLRRQQNEHCSCSLGLEIGGREMRKEEEEGEVTTPD